MMMKRIFIAFILLTIILAAPAALAASTTPKQSTKAFTVDDFTLIPGFTVKADKKYRKDFNFPGYADVVSSFGKPLKETKDGDWKHTLTYNFGTVELTLYDGGVDAFTLTITNAKLPGPRGTNVGDPYDAVFKAFKNKLKKLPKNTTSSLYDQGSNPWYYADAEFSAGVPREIWYCMTNSTGSFCQLNYRLKNGVVTQIVWDLMYAG